MSIESVTERFDKEVEKVSSEIIPKCPLNDCPTKSYTLAIAPLVRDSVRQLEDNVTYMVSNIKIGIETNITKILAMQADILKAIKGDDMGNPGMLKCISDHEERLSTIEKKPSISKEVEDVAGVVAGSVWSRVLKNHGATAATTGMVSSILYGVFEFLKWYFTQPHLQK